MASNRMEEGSVTCLEIMGKECEEERVSESVEKDCEVGVGRSGKMGSSSKGCVEKLNVLSKGEFRLGAVTFTIVGVMMLYLWNVVLSTSLCIAEKYKVDPNLFDWLCAIFQTFNVTTQLTLMYIGGLQKRLFLCGGIVGGILALCVAATHDFASEETGRILMYLLIGPVGTCAGLLLGCGFSFAASMPTNFIGYVILGMGLAGLSSFCLWMLFSKVIFLYSSQHAIWAAYCVTAALLWSGSLLAFYTFNAPWAARALAHMNGTSDLELVDVTEPIEQKKMPKNVGKNNRKNGEELEQNTEKNEIYSPKKTEKNEENSEQKWEKNSEKNSEKYDEGNSRRLSEGRNVVTQSTLTEGYEEASTKPHSPSHECVVWDASSEASMMLAVPTSGEDPVGTYRALLAAKKELIITGLHMLITLQMFPLIGPYSWNGPTLSEKDIIVGMFQLGDFIGSYIPNAADIPVIGKFCVMPPKYLILTLILRVLFIPIFICSYKFEDKVVLNDLWFQALVMFFFALTSGWFHNVSAMYSPTKVRHHKDKARVGLANSVAMMFGIVIGLYSAKLYKL